MVLCAALAAAVIAFSLYVKRSWMGHAFDAIATDEDTARTVGIDVARYKLTAFVFGTALAGLAGALFAHYVKFVTIESFDFVESISVLAMVIVGGIGSVWGVVVAAAFLSVLPLLLQVFADYKLLIYGVLLFAVMRFAPGGIDSLMRMVWRLASRPAQGGVGRGQWTHCSPSTGVSVRFGGVDALAEVSFEVPAGARLLGLIGPNGAGKTTMLRAVTGMVRPQAGSIVLDGAEISRLADPSPGAARPRPLAADRAAVPRHDRGRECRARRRLRQDGGASQGARYRLAAGGAGPRACPARPGRDRRRRRGAAGRTAARPSQAGGGRAGAGARPEGAVARRAAGRPEHDRGRRGSPTRWWT